MPILRIELSETRQAEDWKNHFECLMDNGMEAIYLVSGDRVGLRAGHGAALSHTVRQSDTYHADISIIASDSSLMTDKLSYKLKKKGRF